MMEACKHSSWSAACGNFASTAARLQRLASTAADLLRMVALRGLLASQAVEPGMSWWMRVWGSVPSSPTKFAGGSIGIDCDLLGKRVLTITLIQIGVDLLSRGMSD
uniref:Uncharacterized protein n=1 Tax=Dunaliella tertiolecta TaxID=3047 RepID=A0A7S3R9Z1_DUNTE